MFTFEDTGDAYDACQCREEIRNGDLLDIPAEGVVGLAWTWPVAVTAECGALHSVVGGPDAARRVMEDAKWTEAQVRAAVAHAVKHDLALDPAFAVFA